MTAKGCEVASIAGKQGVQQAMASSIMGHTENV
jgi:hypothetical protein